MTAPLRHQTTESAPRKRKAKDRVVLFDQANATAVLRALHALRPLTQVELAEEVGIAQSAVSGWLTGTRDVTFERIPDLAQIFGVDPLVFLTPVAEVERTIKPHLEAIEKHQSEEIAKALQAIRNMRTYSQIPCQAYLFDPDTASDKQPGRHLQTVQ